MLDVSEQEHAVLKSQLAAEKRQGHHTAAKLERATAASYQLQRDKVCGACSCSGSHSCGPCRNASMSSRHHPTGAVRTHRQPVSYTGGDSQQTTRA